MTVSGLCYCASCGKPLVGNQRRHCSRACKNQYSKTKKLFEEKMKAMARK